MIFFQRICQFLRGNSTTRDLLRLLATSLLAALIAVGLAALFRPRQLPSAPPDAALLQEVLQARHSADQARALLVQWQQQRRIDSLTFLLLKRHELDSMRTHAGLSELDAMRKINGAITNRR